MNCETCGARATVHCERWDCPTIAATPTPIPITRMAVSVLAYRQNRVGRVVLQNLHLMESLREVFEQISYKQLAGNAVEFIGYSDAFDETPVGMAPPRYDPIITVDPESGVKTIAFVKEIA